MDKKGGQKSWSSILTIEYRPYNVDTEWVEIQRNESDDVPQTVLEEIPITPKTDRNPNASEKLRVFADGRFERHSDYGQPQTSVFTEMRKLWKLACRPDFNQPHSDFRQTVPKLVRKIGTNTREDDISEPTRESIRRTLQNVNILCYDTLEDWVINGFLAWYANEMLQRAAPLKFPVATEEALSIRANLWREARELEHPTINALLKKAQQHIRRKLPAPWIEEKPFIWMSQHDSYERWLEAMSEYFAQMANWTFAGRLKPELNTGKVLAMVGALHWMYFELSHLFSPRSRRENCKRCGGNFMPGLNGGYHYCSTQCAEAAKKQRHRAKQAAKHN